MSIKFILISFHITKVCSYVKLLDLTKNTSHLSHIERLAFEKEWIHLQLPYLCSKLSLFSFLLSTDANLLKLLLGGKKINRWIGSRGIIYTYFCARILQSTHLYHDVTSTDFKWQIPWNTGDCSEGTVSAFPYLTILFFVLKNNPRCLSELV